MALATENLNVPKGASWTTITNEGTAFDVQNTSQVLMEYTFTNTVSQGSFLVPYQTIVGVKQTLYVRFYNADQNGTVSITRVS